MWHLWSRVQQWNQRSWWGGITAYVVLVGAAYLTIWKIIEPVGFPDVLPSVPAPMNTRIFYHVIASLLVASHVLLGSWVWSRWRGKSASQRSASETQTIDSSGRGHELLERVRRLEQERDQCCQRLTAYESLEQEIMGLLAPGGDVALHEIATRLGMQDQPDAQKRVRLAVAKLEEQEKIEGTGGHLPTLRRPVRF